MSMIDKIIIDADLICGLFNQMEYMEIGTY